MAILLKGADFAYWWSFIGGGPAPAACAAGLFAYLKFEKLQAATRLHQATQAYEFFENYLQFKVSLKL